MSGAIAAREQVKLMRAEMISFAVGPQAQFSGSHEKLTGSGSEMAVPLSTATKKCFVSASLITTDCQQVQAARQSGEGDNPGSCFVTTARTTARAGGSESDAASMCDGNELWRSPRRQIS